MLLKGSNEMQDNPTYSVEIKLDIKNNKPRYLYQGIILLLNRKDSELFDIRF